MVILEVGDLKPIKLGDVQNIEELKKIVVKLVHDLDSVKYKTEIIKLCFILDYLYCQENNLNIGPTTVGYIKYNYGPYSEQFVVAFDELVNEGKLVQVSLKWGVGYILVKEENTELKEEYKKIIHEVVEKFGKQSLTELKAYIYDLEIFKQATFGEPILLNQNAPQQR